MTDSKTHSSIPIRPGRRTTAALTGLLLAAAVSACASSGTITRAAGAAGGIPAADSTAPDTAGTTATPDAPATPASMSDDAYQAELTGISTALAPDFAAVLKAANADDLKTALGKLSDDAKGQQATMATNPPADASEADGKLSTALTSLADSADSTSQDVGSKVCTAGSATAELSRSDGAGAVRDAAAALTAANPRFKDTVGKFLPGPIADQTRQLANGKVLRHSSGPGSLEIDAADQDAVVTLTLTGSKTPTASIYVRAGHKATLSDIPGKTFDAYVSTGTDWDSTAAKFTRDCSFGKADDTFDFSSSDWSLQLTKQVGGNLSLTDLGPGDAPNP